MQAARPGNSAVGLDQDSRDDGRQAGDMTVPARVRQHRLGISAEEARCARRGFGPTTPSRQQRIERIGQVIVAW